MTINILNAVDYEVKFSRETRDYDVYVDQQYIGTESTYLQGEGLAREYIYDLMEQGKVSDDYRDYIDDAPADDIEIPALKLSPTQRDWLARQLGVLPSAEVVIHALETLEAHALNDNARRAYHRAAQAVEAGEYPQRDGNDWLVVGSKGDVYRVVNRVCSCQAAKHGIACWHAGLARGIEKAMGKKRC